MGRTSARAAGGDTGTQADTAAVADPDSPEGDNGQRERARPVRTCIGCRVRADPLDLVRLVARCEGAAARQVVVPDPGRSAAGRGAHLHPDRRCLDLALRRRAFARSLRVQGALDTGAVQVWVEQHDQQHPRPVPGEHDPQPAPTGAGHDAETEHTLMGPR